MKIMKIESKEFIIGRESDPIKSIPRRRHVAVNGI